jgi:hypothetical protein
MRVLKKGDTALHPIVQCVKDQSATVRIVGRARPPVTVPWSPESSASVSDHELGTSQPSATACSCDRSHAGWTAPGKVLSSRTARVDPRWALAGHAAPLDLNIGHVLSLARTDCHQLTPDPQRSGWRTRHPFLKLRAQVLNPTATTPAGPAAITSSI